MRLTKAIINTSFLKKNYLNIRKQVGKAKIMAVVKADAYGHDVKIVTGLYNSLGALKPEYYAVATLQEALELRSLKIKQPILVFDPVIMNGINYYFEKKIIPAVFTRDHLKILAGYHRSIKASGKIKIHVKVDTGMNRLGVDYKEAFNFISSIDKNIFIIDGIFTHFAASDEINNSYTKLQIKRFDDLIRKLKENKINYGLAHAANSGAIIDYPEAYYDMVRPGISLYGYYPSQKTSESIKLTPVLSLVSEVSSIKKIKKGNSVSYSRKYFTKKDTTIISVPVGYADGFNRNLTNKAKAIINGKTFPQVGTVTMDRIMFDVGSAKVNIGDNVILLGKKNDLKITAWDWSIVLKTIPYEITCMISKRVPRVSTG